MDSVRGSPEFLREVGSRRVKRACMVIESGHRLAVHLVHEHFTNISFLAREDPFSKARLNRMRILIIEDNQDLSLNLCQFLERNGHILDAAADGVTGLHLATVNDYDSIVLDLSLPGLDGLEVCRQLREIARKSTPVLMLTGRDTLEDKLSGFDRGADDYLVKPFELRELEARIRALNARSRIIGDNRVLSVADLNLNLDTLQTQRCDTKIALSPAGLKILELLMRETHRRGQTP